MNLIPEAGKAGKMWSVRLAVLAAALGAVEATLPLWQDIIPAGLFAGLSSLVGIAAAVARVVKQTAVSGE